MPWRSAGGRTPGAQEETASSIATGDPVVGGPLVACDACPILRRGRWGHAQALREDRREEHQPQKDIGQRQLQECVNDSLPFGPGSSPSWSLPGASAVYKQNSPGQGDSTSIDGRLLADDDNDSVANSSDDEGESMMPATGQPSGEPGRKMYFSTLHDSLEKHGLPDTPGALMQVASPEDGMVNADAGSASLATIRWTPLSASGIGSSNRSFFEGNDIGVSGEPSSGEVLRRTTVQQFSEAETSILARESTARQRNERRGRRRAEARGCPQERPSKPGGCVFLIREDCRLHDNPALHAAAENHPWVLPLYVHDDSDPSPWPVRGAGLWWRHESLKTFDASLSNLGSRIVYRRGCLIEQVVDVLLETQATALHFNLQLEPWHHKRDLELEAAIVDSLGLQVRTFTAMVMKFEPWEERARGPDRPKRQFQEPLPPVRGKLPPPPGELPWSLTLATLGYGRTAGRKIPPGFRQYNEERQVLLEAGSADLKVDDWAYEMHRFWPMGELAAMRRLEEWLKDAAWGCYFPPGLNPRDEAGGRFRADKPWTAMISPYLRFGDLSPRYVDWRCREVLSHDLRHLFLKRVVWRDKAYSQLYRCPDSHALSIRSQYEHEAWSGTRLALRRWQRGETGYPLVDAAMRQLWKVGWMCNHLRHVTAQFLIEHLDLSWKEGFAWYDYTLVDTDVAINAMMWQMGGHSGIGSWNFVMHPVYAGKKVDPNGDYVRRWLPELRHLPTEYIHCPWEAPAGARISANVLINGVYWQRVIEDLIAARLVHQRNVIAVRKRFPEFVEKDGNEVIRLMSGQVLHLDVRDDIRENDENNITLKMTADDPRSMLRRNLGSTKGVHSTLIYEESKKFEALYDAFDSAPRRKEPSRSKDRAGERALRRNQHGELVGA